MFSGQGYLVQTVLYLCRIMNLFLSYFCHPDNGIHGSPDIMRHGRKEFCLCHIGILGFLDTPSKPFVYMQDIASVKQQEEDKSHNYI